MNAVGVFAGRGDVILGMGIALLFGIWIGWALKGYAISVRSWRVWSLFKRKST